MNECTGAHTRRLLTSPVHFSARPEPVLSLTPVNHPAYPTKSAHVKPKSRRVFSPECKDARTERGSLTSCRSLPRQASRILRRGRILFRIESRKAPSRANHGRGSMGGYWDKHSTDVEYLPPPPRVGMSVHLEIVIRYIFVGLLSMTVCLVRGVIESKHSTEVDSPPPPSPQCVCVHIHPDGERQGMLQSWDNSLFSMALLPSRGGSLLRPMTRP